MNRLIKVLLALVVIRMATPFVLSFIMPPSPQYNGYQSYSSGHQSIVRDNGKIISNTNNEISWAGCLREINTICGPAFHSIEELKHSAETRMQATDRIDRIVRANQPMFECVRNNEANVSTRCRQELTINENALLVYKTDKSKLMKYKLLDYLLSTRVVNMIYPERRLDQSLAMHSEGG